MFLILTHLADQPLAPQPRRINTLGLWIGVCALLTVASISSLDQGAYATSGDDLFIPRTRTGLPRFSKQSGLQVRVNSRWAGTRGYRPVTVTISAAKPTTADTLLTIQFHAGTWRNSERVISVEQDFELARGSSSATITLMVPQYTDWNTVGWTVWVDGVMDEELSMQALGFSIGTSGSVTVGTLLPTKDHLYSNRLLGLLIKDTLNEQILDMTNLPKHWIDYSTFDIVATSVDSLKHTHNSAPERFASLLRWVRAGGNLWLIGPDQDLKQLPALESLLNSLQDSELANNEQLLSNWHFLGQEPSNRVRLDNLVELAMQKEDSRVLTSDWMAKQSNVETNDARRWFAARAYGLGQIVAWKTADFNLKRHNPIFYADRLLSNLDWATRHGNDPAGGNPDFNNLLIPDVGTAPVFEFQLLISLFVIAIGPVNYWLLKRRNQLPLLLITVPLAALAATVMLFAYGLFADGVSTRVRVRSMSLLDQKSSEVASWARLSYYAGVAPSGGLKMPADTAVYPILPSQVGRTRLGSSLSNQLHAIEWKNNQQLLTRGWLGSRTPTQYLAITARPTQKHLKIDEQAEQLTVTNHLGTPIVAIAVQNHEGNIFFSDTLIDPKGKAQLSSTTYLKAASKLRQLLTENLPQLPPEYAQSYRSRRNVYNTPMSESLLELQLEACVSPLAQGWGKGVYFAVTAAGIEVPLGLDDATESKSFHVLRGTW